MSAPKSISALLGDALDLIGTEVSESGEKAKEISASKTLLGERSKLKRGIDNEDFVRFDSAAEKKVKVTPFMEQISSSSVDDPKYWKSASGSKMEIKNMKFNVGTKGSSSQNKAQKKRQKKGQDYHERYTAKQSGVTQRDSLRRVLKS